MYLEKINGPADIKRLEVSQLQTLADETRSALINKISKAGGHQGPNLGVVSYPGLPSNPGHELAKRQMKNGYGGVISFGVDTDDKTVERFCAALKVVMFAVSLGHDESLIFPQLSYDERINLYPEKFRKGFIRFSVGLEDPDDIIADLDQALKSVGL